MEQAPTWTENNGINILVYTMKAGDITVPFALSGLSNKTVDITGVFGGAVLTIKGKDSTEFTMNDSGNVPLVFNTLSGIKTLQENPSLINPVLSGGDGTTNLTITFVIQ